MPHEPSLPSPGDFFIGIVEFFAILVPGVIGAALLAWQIAPRAALPEKHEALFWVGLFVAGYILGHLLYAVSSLLDPLLYDPIFGAESDVTKCYLMDHPRPERKELFKRLIFTTREFCHRNHQLYAYARKRVKELEGYSQGMPESVFRKEDLENVRYDPAKSEARPAGIYQWTRAWLRSHCAEATAELDRLEADSKLFRSLSVILPIFLVVRWHWLWAQGWFPPILLIVAIVLSLWRYCDLRQKTVRACYLHFVQLRWEPAPPPQSPDRHPGLFDHQ